jgi:hypothetical protein
MKIVRTVWGSLEYVKRETLDKHKYENEVVYVWGKENQEHLISLGYETILAHSQDHYYKYDRMVNKYYHKLEVVARADEDFEEYLLLDWDTYPIGEISEAKLQLNKKSPVQCPLYAIPENFYDIISQHPMDNEMREFFYYQSRFLETHSWKIQQGRAFPNFCFFYSRKANIGRELLKIAKKQQILSNIEEFSLFKWANCSIEEYIKIHEPLVIRAQESDPLPQVQFALDSINVLTNERKDKKIYFVHK